MKPLYTLKSLRQLKALTHLVQTQKGEKYVPRQEKSLPKYLILAAANSRYC